MRSLPPARPSRPRASTCFPGVMDPHVHLGFSGSFANDCRTESLSALSAGTTTLSALLREPGSYLKTFPDFRKDAEANSYTDMVFSIRLGEERQVEEIPEYVDRLGVTGFKCYQYGLPGIVEAEDDGLMFMAMKTLAKLGDPTFLAIHCENEDLVIQATERVRAKKKKRRPRRLGGYAPRRGRGRGRPPGGLSIRSDGRAGLHRPPLDRPGGEAAARASPAEPEPPRRDNLPQPVHHEVLEKRGSSPKCRPPSARPNQSRRSGRRCGTGISTPWARTTRPGRGRKRTFEEGSGAPRRESRPSEPTCPSCCMRATTSGAFPLVRIAEATSRNPARIYGVYPQKGDIRPGTDADLALVDLETEKRVRPEKLHSFSDFSLYEGDVLKGWPKAIIKGGRLALVDDEVRIEPGAGRYLRRKLASGRRATDMTR